MKSSDIEFMDELEAAENLRSNLASNLLLLTIAVMVAFFVIWAALSEVDELTRGSGQVVPSQEVQIVQSLEGGILSELLVEQGQRVKKGEVLVRISDVEFAAEESSTEGRFAGLQLRKARLEAEANGNEFIAPETFKAQAPDVAANESALYASRQQELKNALSILKDQRDQARSEIAETNAQIRRLQDSRNLLNEELKLTSEMVAQRAVPKLEEIRLQRELSDINGQLNANRQKLSGLNAALRSTEKQLEDQEDKFRSQALGELSEIESQIMQIEESLKAIGDRVFRRELRAPVDGVVNSIAINTIGGVIEPAKPLVEIVPIDDELKIIARVSPNDIAFLERGQPVKVKITAYDPQRYGSLKGELVRIGANSNTDNDGNTFFEIEVKTYEDHLGTETKKLPVTSGMLADIDIITGRRSILEYLVKPVLRIKDRALRER